MAQVEKPPEAPPDSGLTRHEMVLDKPPVRIGTISIEAGQPGFKYRRDVLRQPGRQNYSSGSPERRHHLGRPLLYFTFDTG
jgi:hypothetical protein